MKRASFRRNNIKGIGKCILSFIIIFTFFLLFSSTKINEDSEAQAQSADYSVIKSPTQLQNKILSLSETLAYNQIPVFQVRNLSPNEKMQIVGQSLSENSKKDQNIQIKKQTQTNINNKSTEIKKETPTKTVAPATKNKKVVYLTFDDGPSYVSKDFLKLLKKYNAKATFFMLEPNMKRYSSSVKQMVKEGHSVGMHGVTHDVKKVYKSPQSFIIEMNKGQKTLKGIAGVESKLIRAPYGSVPYVTKPYRKEIDKDGFLMWDWDIDSNDWRTTKDEYVKMVIHQVEECSGNMPIVVLMHDKQTTVKNLEPLLQYFQKKGYKMEGIKEDFIPVQFKNTK